MDTIATSKGQIVIPSKVRRNFEIEEGTRIEIVEDLERGLIILKPITPQYVRKLRGMLKGGGGLKALKEDRQKEKNL